MKCDVQNEQICFFGWAIKKCQGLKFPYFDSLPKIYPYFNFRSLNLEMPFCFNLSFLVLIMNYSEEPKVKCII